MFVHLFMILTVALVGAVIYGRRYNQRWAAAVIRVIEAQFHPDTAEYVTIGSGLGYGFDYTCTSGPFPEIQGVLTLLPRYTPLYLPIARMIGRQDLLKLTFHCGDALPSGVGAIVHTNCIYSRWFAIEEDEDWQERKVALDERRFTIYYYNPAVARRLEEIIPALGEIPGINQIAVDSRKGTITTFLTPRGDTICRELQKLAEIVFSLTGRYGQNTMG
ncbi:MAG: hypothetical protein ACLFSV_03835 [Alkalispirochaeta sp.]